MIICSDNVIMIIVIMIICIDNDNLFAVIMPESELANRQVINNRQLQHRNTINRKHVSKRAYLSLPSTAWEPSGVLVSHLHEHTARVHRMCAVEGTALFATASQDGTVRIWDAHKTEREHPINRWGC